MDIYRVKPGAHVDLRQYDPADKSAFEGDKSAGEKAVEKLNRRLEILQELLFAEGKHKVLIVLQAMDTGGKDGVIRHVFDGVNPQGVKVASFKTPTPEELTHDYLWRIHKHTPGRGEMVIFNRSHYEDVLVVRVHNLVPPEVWRRRYAHINDFERMLTEEGTTILKFFLHISKDEQKARLQARLDEPEKRWKFNVGDLGERALWDDYMGAYETVLSETSSAWAPWYIVPSNRKWYRDLVISEVLVKTLEDFAMRYPQPGENLDEVVIE
ncbi:MAG TPA: polyphosphate kinase 2 family protein [Anaerolineae bacterium]|nr:polyphosphate kinase 2 family protein [Anaerolineae bacterium]HQH38329.1 polyphosphate kinase 2 family protein [Anaerolineae bacterium]